MASRVACFLVICVVAALALGATVVVTHPSQHIVNVAKTTATSSGQNNVPYVVPSSATLIVTDFKAYAQTGVTFEIRETSTGVDALKIPAQLTLGDYRPQTGIVFNAGSSVVVRGVSGSGSIQYVMSGYLQRP